MMTLAKALFPWLGIFASILLSIIVVPEAVDGIEVSQDVPHYRSTRAEVTNQFEKKRNKGPNSYVVEFRYTVENRKLRGTNRFTSWTDDEKLVNRLIRKEKDGKKTILVFYDPVEPKHVVIHQDVSIWPHVIWILVTIILFIFSIVFAAESVRRKHYLKRSRARLDKRAQVSSKDASRD